MTEQNPELMRKLGDLMQKTGYPLVQKNGQRKFGPPPEWCGPVPPKGCEVFIGKLPREIYEDELVPLFSKVGRIYEMRLMMDFSGSNRGYAFVTFASKAEACRAVKELDGYEIKPGRKIGVVKSVDNCRLFVGNIPKTKTKEEVREELLTKVTGITDVILYTNCFDRRQNRGFAFVEFTTHRAAAMARRALVPGCVKLWDQEVNVDWAEPEPDVDEDQMNKVKVLYIRNFLIKTTPDTIKSIIESAIDKKIERVKKMYDYAFVHFFEREHAELALKKLQNTDIDGSVVEIKWGKPVDRELYHIQKKNRGNAKFNKISDLSHTLMLYKQHLAKKEYANSPTKDEGIGSTCGVSPSISPISSNRMFQQTETKENYTLAPAKLEAVCKRNLWMAPAYDYLKYVNDKGIELWVAKVELPQVGMPLLAFPQPIGPFQSGFCYNVQQAQVQAAQVALNAIQKLREPVQQSQVPLRQIYPTVVQPMPSCVGLPFDFTNSSICSQSLQPLPIPTIWGSF